MIDLAKNKWEENKDNLERYFKENAHEEYTTCNFSFAETVFDLIINRNSNEKYLKDSIWACFDDKTQDDEIFIFHKKEIDIFSILFLYIRHDSEYKNLIDDLYDSEFFDETEKPNKEQLKKYMDFAFYLISNMKQISND